MIYKDSANLELQQLYQYMKKEFKSIASVNFLLFYLILRQLFSHTLQLHHPI